MKRYIICLGIIVSCMLLSGCAVTEDGKYYFSVFAQVLDAAYEERAQDCRLIVRDADGEALYESADKEVLAFFAEMVEQLQEDDVEFSAQGKVMYEYEAWDNDNKVVFYLYEPGDVLSLGVGRLQVYFHLSDELKEIFLRPETWMDME